MTQPLPTDFPIDPTTTSGTALAEILNRFADSVATSNSGPTAPADTQPGMQWLDTSGATPILRIRNSDNTAWNMLMDTSKTAATTADIANVNSQITALTGTVNGKVAKTGDTMTGNLTVPGVFVGPTSYFAQGGNGVVLNYTTGWYWDFNMSSGALTWVRPGIPSTTFDQQGGLALNGGNFSANQINSQGNLGVGGRADIASDMSVMGNLACANQIQAPNLFGSQLIYGNPSQGLIFSPPYYNGSNYYMCKSFGGDPAYGTPMSVSALHFPGTWAGIRLQAANAGYDFYSDGSAHFPGGVVQVSDERLKTDVEPIPDARSKVAQLLGCTYERTDLTDYDGNPVEEAGLMAQAVAKVLPQAAKLQHRKRMTMTLNEDGSSATALADDPEDEVYGVNYSAVIALLVNDNNAMAARLDALEAAAAPAA